MAGTGGQQHSGTSVAFLTQLKEKHPGPLRVIWDNAPAHRGEAVREYLRTPELELRLVNLPSYSPDFNADDVGRERRSLAICAWAAGRRSGAGRQIPGRAPAGKTGAPRRFAIGPKHSRETPAIPNTRQMHIPPWLWFRIPYEERGEAWNAPPPFHIQTQKQEKSDETMVFWLTSSQAFARIAP